MYGKIFAQLYDSTLATKGPWEAMALWPHMIALCNRHGEVDMPAEIISRRTTLPLPIVIAGLKALSEPDPQSRSSLEGGRRIVLINPDRNWGWRLVNYEHYARIRSNDERREYHRRKVKEIRDLSKKVVTGGHKVVTLVTVTDVPHASASASAVDLNPVPKKPKKPGRPKTAGEFDRFWSAWPPNKRKVGKARCIVTWKAQELDKHVEAVLAHVEVMKRSEQWVEFCPSPATYLNQKRWQDPIYTEPRDDDRDYI